MTFRLWLGGLTTAGAGATAAYMHHHHQKTNNVALAKPKFRDSRTSPVSVLEAIGNTPLIEIKSLSELTGCRIVAKGEHLNPGGSVKDRAALYLIEDAERQGHLKPGGTIVEGTGGNTGIGLALVAAAKGYKAIFSLPKSVAKEKIDLMEVLGAQVIKCDPVPYTDPSHYFHVAQRLGKKENHVSMEQFENTANARAHYEGTAPEMLKQTQGKLDAFICAAGTGGTIGGVSTYLKEHIPDCKVYLADPEGSGLYPAVTKDLAGIQHGVELIAVGLPTLSYKRSEGGSIAEGIGTDRKTANFAMAIDGKNLDGALQVTDEEVVNMAYHLLRNDGLFIGPSAALNVVGAYKIAKQLGPGHTVATIICDSGDRYRSKLYNAKWLEDRNLKPSPLV